MMLLPYITVAKNKKKRKFEPGVNLNHNIYARNRWCHYTSLGYTADNR